jgi:hypothetical protein
LPLAKQERIVAKVDELMVFCDILEAELVEAEIVRAGWQGCTQSHKHNVTKLVEYRGSFWRYQSNKEKIRVYVFLSLRFTVMTVTTRSASFTR